MCCFVYNGSYPRNFDKKCPYPDLYVKKFQKVLSLDKEGYCVFHSKDILWKKENNFKEKLLKIIDILNKEKNNKYCNFSGFVFIGDEPRSRLGIKNNALNLDKILFLKKVYFIKADFIDSFELRNISFQDGVNFSQATFHEELIIDNSEFSGVVFDKAKFLNRVLLSSVIFTNYTSFYKTNFIGSVAGASIKFENIKFTGMTDFSNALFYSSNKETTVKFKKIQFEKSTDFSNSEFKNRVVFSDVSFADNIEFIDTLFESSASSARYNGENTEFRNVTISEGATLYFKSTNANKKLFNNDIFISFKNNMLGNIEFENVNFTKFSSTSKKDLLQLEKLGRVTIGSGCIKYRHQTEIKQISISQGNASLILELCQTFTNYFTENNGFNLGFEIVERNKNNVYFFYFSDENISKEEFYKKLEVTGEKLWGLLLNNNRDVYLTLKNKQIANNENKNQIINTIDGLSALLTTFFRVGARISFGAWTEADTTSLLSAIPVRKNINIQNQSFHRVLIDKYTGENLFAFSLQQNKGLSIIQETTYNMYGGNAKVFNDDSKDNSTINYSDKKT